MLAFVVADREHRVAAELLLAGAIEFDRRKQRLRDFVPSRLFIYYNERAIEGTVSIDSGAMIRDGIGTIPSEPTSFSNDS